MALPLDTALAVCSPNLSTDNFVQHNLSSSYCVLCGIGEIRILITNPRDNDDLSDLVVTEDLRASGLTYVPGSTTFTWTNTPAAPPRPAAFNPVVSGANGSLLTWTFPAYTMVGTPSSNDTQLEIRFQVRRYPSLTEEGLVTANRNIEARFSFAPSCTSGRYTDNDIDELPIRQPIPTVTKLGRNADAGQTSGQYNRPVYGNINDDVIWRIQVRNSGLAGMEDLRISDVMGSGNFVINYVCPNETTATAITNNNGILPGGSTCRVASNNFPNFAVDDPFGSPSNDQPGAYVDAPAGGSAFIYFVGKITSSCVGPRTNTVSNVQWGCEVNPPDGGISVPASTGGSTPGYRTTHTADLSTVATMSGLTVTQNLTGTNTSQPVGSKGTVTLIIRNQTGGTVKNINLLDTLPPEYVVDSTYTPTVRMTPAYGNGYAGMTDNITWTNPVAGTFPLTTTNPALPLSNTAPRFSLTSTGCSLAPCGTADVHVNYPDQRNLMRHGDVLTVTYRIILIRPLAYDKVANLDVRLEEPNSSPPGTDPVNNTPSLTNRIDLDYEQFCNPGIIQRPAQMVRSNIPVSPEDLDIDIVGTELIFILTNDPAQRLPLTVSLRNNGGHDARDFSAYVTFGQSMSVVTVPAGCSLTSNPPALPPWRLPAPLPATASVYRCVQAVIAPSTTVLYNFEVIKNSTVGVDDDLTFRADVIGEITLSSGAPLWFPTPTARADGITDRGNNYSLDGIRARVIGFNLLKSRVGDCSENNPPPSPDLQVQIGEECGFHIETGGWFGFQTPGFTYIAVQRIQAVDPLPNGQGYISSTDPYATGTTSAIQGILLNPATLQPVDEGSIDWTFNQIVPAQRITAKDHWFRVNMVSRLLNDPVNTVAAPNLHAALSTNILVSTFEAVFMNENLMPPQEEVYTLGPTTVGYPRESVRRVSLTVTEPRLLITKEVCNETLYGVGTACSNWVTATAEGSAQNSYIYRVRLTNEASSSGVTRAPAYDVVTTDILDSSDLAYVQPFETDGLDNDGDGLIDGADTDGEGTIDDNTVKNSLPATIHFSHTNSAPLLRINPGSTVTFYYRVDFDDTAAPRQTFINNVNASYDSLTGPTGNQSLAPRPNGDIGGARVYTSATATAQVQILPVLTQPKRITRVSNSVLVSGAPQPPQPVSIGEEFEYELTTSIPVATLKSFVIRDTLPAGVRCTDAPVVNLNDPLYAGAGFVPGGSFTPTCSTTGTFVEWNFGDQTVTLGGVGNRYDFSIRFIARLENLTTTNSGNVIRNGGTATAVTATYIDEANATVTLNFAASDITLREPIIVLTKQFSRATADAGDRLTVTVTARNTGNATAYNLRVLDDLTGTQLTYFGMPGLPAGTDQPDNVGFTLGANRPVFSWNSANPSFAIAPGQTRTFSFEVTVDGTVQPLETLDNIVQASWTSLPGITTALNSAGTIGPDGSSLGMRNGALPNAAQPINDYEATATHSFSVPPLSMNKTVLPPPVVPAIGGHQQFQVEIHLPEGTTKNLLVTDNLIASGISYYLANNVDFDITYEFVDIASINGQPPSESAMLAFPADNTANSAVWNLGTVVTTNENDPLVTAMNPVIRIKYFARPNNDTATNSGNLLRNAVTVNYSHGETGVTQTLTATTPAVTVVEPVLSLTKTVTAAGVGPSPGDTLQYRVTLSNTGNSTAYDINIVDTLPAGVILDLSVPPTATIASVPVPGFVSTPANAPAGPLTWGRDNADDSLDLLAGQTLIVDYQVIVQLVVDPTGLIGNSVHADWTSLDGDSTYERNGNGCPIITPPDDYCVGPVSATIVGVPIDIQFEKSVANRTRPGLVTTTGALAAMPGDVLRYHIHLVNRSGNPLTGIDVADDPDAANGVAKFVAGTLTVVSTTPAPPFSAATNLTDANGGSKGTGLLYFRNLTLGPAGGGNDTLDIFFDIQLVGVIDSNSVALNQARVVRSGVTMQLSDDTTVSGATDPTTITILSAPAFRVQKTSQDITGDPAVLLPGDTLRYTITVKNIGTESATNVTLRDLIPANTTYVAESTRMNGVAVPDAPTSGTSVLQSNFRINAIEDPTSGFMRAEANVAVTGNVATVVFDVVINAGVVDGTIISNQGFVNGTGTNSGAFPEKPSDDPATPAVDDPTRNVVGNLPLLYTQKTVQILTDTPPLGIVNIGDTLRYTFTITNTGARPATGVALVDNLPNDTTYVANSFQLNGLTIIGAFPPGLPGGVAISSSDLTPPLPATGAGTVSVGGTATAIFDVVVASTPSVIPPNPPVPIISNQATLTSIELLPQLSDADGNPANGYQPTQVVVGSGQQLVISKTVAVVGGGPAIVGSTLEYVVLVRNISLANATNVVITDTIPPDPLLPPPSPGYGLSYVAGSATLNGATFGVTDTGPGMPTIVADYSSPYGPLIPGATAELRFRVQIDSGPIGARIINVGRVTWGTTGQSDSAQAAVDIGGVPGSAIINGTAWHDADFNNALGATELLLAGWEVQLSRYQTPAGARTLLATVLTNASGAYQFSGLAPTSASSQRYELRFRAPGAGATTALLGLAYSPPALGFTNSLQQISEIDVGSGAYLLNLDLPINPDGVVYNAVLRNPIPGARLTMVQSPLPTPPASAVALPASCFDDPQQQNQVTLSSGYYKFDLNFSDALCPAGGNYLIQVSLPTAVYAPGPSAIIPPASSAATPAYSVPVCSADAIAPAPSAGYCEAVISELSPPLSVPAPSAATTYYLHATFGNGARPNESQLFNNHIPVDPNIGSAVSVSKITPLVNVIRGQLVPYTITVRNTLAASIPNLVILDILPPGFKYVTGSARMNGVAVEPLLTGHQLTWGNVTLLGGATHTLKLLLIVGSGVSEGEYVNRAQVVTNSAATNGSNIATATVRVVPDPTFDCTDIIGKVFDDVNANGYQDNGEAGLPGVRIVSARGLIATTDKYGRYHITCAAVPNEDRGSNFILKLDDRTLPSGYRVTTENPLVLRATRGKMIKFNFGAGLHRVVRLDISDSVFEPETTGMRPQWQPRTGLLIGELIKAPAILRVTYLADVEDEKLVTRRLNVVKQALLAEWKKEKRGYELIVETEIYWRRGGPPTEKALTQ